LQGLLVQRVDRELQDSSEISVRDLVAKQLLELLQLIVGLLVDGDLKLEAAGAQRCG
jgi:hypothetical protein